jgi:succinyl-diaminopimelate desuccinylase
MISGEISRALRETALAITAIPSMIGEERALCDHVAARLGRSLGAGAISRHRDSLVVRAVERAGAPKIALVGHLDTVRTRHDGPARIEGERLYGAGAADMKSGLAVMIELVERLDRATLPCDLTLVFYEREEGPYVENVLGELLERFPALRALDFAICLEPSSNELQLGCMGSVHATVRFEGKTAHSARPWQGESAIYKALPFLGELAARAPRDVDVEGHRFREVLTPTLASAGTGRNIVPDRFEINVNYRFAPPRTPDDAIEELRALVAGRAAVEPVDRSPAARPHATHALTQRLIASGVRGVATKQAWTDVARFDALGVAAVNFGPGLQAQAHQPNEYTELPLLDEGYAILERFLTARAG